MQNKKKNTLYIQLKKQSFRAVLGMIAFLCYQNTCHSQSTIIKKEIEKIVADKNVKLGFALYDFSDNRIISIHGKHKFPMQSVYKFPIAVALLDEIERNKLSLNDSIIITAKDLEQNTWSPIKDRWPNGITLSIEDMMTYMVAHSDNIATDILIEKVGGIPHIQNTINNLGGKNIYIRNTEKELHSDRFLQYQNWTTPIAMVRFLKRMEDGKLLNKNNCDLLWNIMVNTSTGSIHKYIPLTHTIAHKTGSSGVNSLGMTAAQNDVGIIQFENGKRICFAIFLTDSYLSTDEGYELIAQIGKIIYSAYTNTAIKL